ncbi:MAG: YceI family protein [bacterium]
MKNRILQSSRNKLKILIILLIFGLYSSSQVLYSQALYSISNNKDVNMKLSGTSTLHNWNMNSKSIVGEANFEFAGDNLSELKDLSSLKVILPTSSLKSKEKQMDKNVYGALKADKYKDIVFKITSANVQPKQNNRYQLKTVGNLTIAGVTRQVNLDVFCQINEDQTITCSGTEKLKMTDYQVTPPTFLLGAMKTGDEVTLDFTVVFKKSNLSSINH